MLPLWVVLSNLRAGLTAVVHTGEPGHTGLRLKQPPPPAIFSHKIVCLAALLLLGSQVLNLTCYVMM